MNQSEARPMRKAASADVIECYRLFLGREPESEEVVQWHLGARPDLWELIKAFEQCPERARRAVDSVWATLQSLPDARAIEVDATPEDLARLMQHVKAAWSALGSTEPYWSVLNSNRYFSKEMDDERVDQFYQSGSHEAVFFETVCERNGVNVDRSWRILDLGCGVGRIGEHFARVYRAYFGVDISAAHLAQARRRFDARHLTNFQFFLLKDFIVGSPGFDVFFSVLTLQHNPPPIILHLLTQCLGRLAPGGYAFFQLPCHLYNYEFSTARYLAAADSPARMEMHPLPQAQLFKAIAEDGLVPIEVFPWPRIGPIGVSYGFFARKSP